MLKLMELCEIMRNNGEKASSLMWGVMLIGQFPRCSESVCITRPPRARPALRIISTGCRHCPAHHYRSSCGRACALRMCLYLCIVSAHHYRSSGGRACALCMCLYLCIVSAPVPAVHFFMCVDHVMLGGSRCACHAHASLSGFVFCRDVCLPENVWRRQQLFQSLFLWAVGHSHVYYFQHYSRPPVRV